MGVNCTCSSGIVASLFEETGCPSVLDVALLETENGGTLRRGTFALLALYHVACGDAAVEESSKLTGRGMMLKATANASMWQSVGESDGDKGYHISQWARADV